MGKVTVSVLNDEATSAHAGRGCVGKVTASVLNDEAMNALVGRSCE